MVAPTAALIVAAGSSLRFGQDKLLATVHGQSLISYSLQAFAKVALIDAIVLVVPPGRKELFSQIIAKTNNRRLVSMTKVVTGGETRYESVQSGLAALPGTTSFVAIHDGARPLITSQIIESVIYRAYEYGAAALAHRVVETLHRASKNGMSVETIERNNLWAMQTPQVFRVSDLINHAARRCFKKNLANSMPTDEVSALLCDGIQTYFVENREPNIKVTYPEDLALVAAYLA